VSLSIASGTFVGVVGRNGAGKTSLMRAIMGLLPASSGEMGFQGTGMRPLPPQARAGFGIGYMPEDRRLVPDLTVEENVLVPA
jgi:branched-chain amino acid transport system ATP-binding protein